MGVHKGRGLECWAHHLGCTLANVIAIGDSENDLEMLNAVALPIAMGNASAAVKNLCLRETLTNAQDGVASRHRPHHRRERLKRADGPLSGKTVVKIGFLCYNILAEYPQKAEKRRRTPSD